MLRSLKIENFRCFPSFELNKLGRINLLVGKNNSGKTSILEAIQMLYSENNLETLGDTMKNRGEYLLDEGKNEYDIRHLFYGHEINLDSEFSIEGINLENNNRLKFSLSLIEDSDLIEDSNLESFDIVPRLMIKWLPKEKGEINFPLSINGGLNVDYFRRQRLQRTLRGTNKTDKPTQFVRSSSLDKETMKNLFDQIVLTPDEDLVIQALKSIEPDIERIASINPRLRGSFVVQKTNNSDQRIPLASMINFQRIPIGSMGDGISRILGLTLAIINAKNGVLLVDEIDTGLHFSAMSDMWKLLYETAKRLNVQVFATTHSRDCWESLAEIAEAKDSSENDITIHRIEKGRASSIVIGEDEMAIAAERGIEVR
ncbi:MAG: chromosome segregation protein SMC [Snowella sp.]|jgi:AAA15 family ATPase/GTPase|nr:MAG: chromosome segregation protein SMC [Snowella sp.]